MIQQAKQLLTQIKGMTNPGAALNNALMNNPQFKNVMNFIQTKHNGNAKEAFYDYAKQNGIDPDEFLKQLNSL